MPTNKTQSIDRAIAILDYFSVDHPEAGVREIARHLHLHPSTVGRMLATLTSLDILIQDDASHRYKMGSKVLNCGAVYLGNLNLQNVARP